MTTNDKGIYLGKRGQIFGPFTEEQVEQMQLSGEIESYSYRWDPATRAWRALDPVPPEPGIDRAARKDLPSWTRVEAVCHNFQVAVSGLLDNVTEAGCDLISTDHSESPKLALRSSVVLNVIDPKQEKAMNVRTSLAEVTRRQGSWVYHLRWARVPAFAVVLLAILISFTTPAWAAGPTVSPTDSRAQGSAAPAAGEPGEEADVEKIKEKYWARGNESEMGVVQNRLYPKRHRIELSLLGGTVNGDPFLSIVNYGGSIGFHFSEFLALHVIGWKTSVSPSSALTAFQDQTHQTVATNRPNSYLGGEVRASVLYGKLSLLGAAILYFDAYFSGGAGKIATDSGSDLLYSIGVGQQIHLSRLFSLNLEYKFLYYHETVGPNNHANLSGALTLGLSIFLDPFDADHRS